MQELGIIARFPLGVYTGHKQDGSADTFPEPVRLHAALVSSAAQGSLAVTNEKGELEPSKASLKALKWLEENPPDGIEIPESHPVHKGSIRFTYRNITNITVISRPKEGQISDGTALGGNIGWYWKQVPDDIANTLEQLCADVPYLGESTSVTVLGSGDVSPNLIL